MFDIQAMLQKIIDNGEIWYLFNIHNAEILDKDVEVINKILKGNEQLAANVPNHYIPTLNYDDKLQTNGPTNYTYLSVNNKTPTGRSPKYKYVVHFNTFVGDYLKEWGNDTFGEIHYLQNNTIGKVRIIMWRNKILTVIHLNNKEGNLYISKIENH